MTAMMDSHFSHQSPTNGSPLAIAGGPVAGGAVAGGAAAAAAAASDPKERQIAAAAAAEAERLRLKGEKDRKNKEKREKDKADALAAKAIFDASPAGKAKKQVSETNTLIDSCAIYIASAKKAFFLEHDHEQRGGQDLRLSAASSHEPKATLDCCPERRRWRRFGDQ